MTNKEEILTAATRYHGGLVRPERTEGDFIIDLLASLPWGTWTTPEAIFTQDATTHAAQAYPKRKACARSGLVSEVCQMYLDTGQRAAAHWAWASTELVMSGGPSSQKQEGLHIGSVMEAVRVEKQVTNSSDNEIYESSGSSAGDRHSPMCRGMAEISRQVSFGAGVSAEFVLRGERRGRRTGNSTTRHESKCKLILSAILR